LRDEAGVAGGNVISSTGGGAEEGGGRGAGVILVGSTYNEGGLMSDVDHIMV